MHSRNDFNYSNLGRRTRRSDFSEVLLFFSSRLNENIPFRRPCCGMFGSADASAQVRRRAKAPPIITSTVGKKVIVYICLLVFSELTPAKPHPLHHHHNKKTRPHKF